jgi:cyclopropane fatty-acyl-phospholipid synthase-like methyltransferase
MSLISFLKRQVKKVLRPEPPASPPQPARVGTSINRGKAPHKLADVLNHYETLTPIYHEKVGEIFQAARPLDVEELLNHELRSLQFEDGQRVLDAGCGMAGPAIWFAQRKQITIDGVTLSTKQVALGEAAIQAANMIDRVRIHLGDFHKLHELFPANTFDRVYFLESICHAEDYERVLASAWKVLKPGGRIYIKDFLERDLSDDPASQKRGDEFLKKCYAEYSFALVQKNEMAALIEKTGFQIEMIEPIPFSHDREDHARQIAFENAAGLHWRDGVDLWIIESYEVRARKP